MLWRPRLSDTRETLVDHIVCTVVLVIPSRAFCSASEIAVWSQVEQISCLGDVWHGQQENASHGATGLRQESTIT
jgi:hypothetical protein